MRLRVHCYGGSLDGQDALVDTDGLAVFNQATLYPVTAGDDPEAEPLTDEPYVFGVMQAAGDPSDDLPFIDPAWFVVWAPIVQPQIRAALRARADAGPDAERMRTQHEALGGVLLTEPCPPGEHSWTEWKTTPKGNQVRSCEKCGLGQGTIV